jgi:hypothetical protein
MIRDAWISEDGRYRYRLKRTWIPSTTPVVFVMLNPSTADATVDDPTVRRCVAFAKAWGFGGMVVVNLYALRATNPKALWADPDPVGPYNDRELTAVAQSAAALQFPVIAAWGANARPDRVAAVRALPGMSNLRCLGTTKGGAPKHPLYLRADSALVAYPGRGWTSNG